jgi:hypothetical protein
MKKEIRVVAELAFLTTKLGNKTRGRKESLTLFWWMTGIDCTGNINFVLKL